MLKNFLPIIFCLASSTAALARVDFASELMRSNILRSDQSVSADVRGRDATISTYMNKQAVKNKDAVCRLDALLIAKKVTELDASIKKVRVWFHEYSGPKYREVIVSADDLKAFEAGKIKQPQLLGRLKVRLATSLKSAESYAPASQAVNQSGIKTGTGLAFYYPKNWRAMPHSADTRLLAELTFAETVSGAAVGADVKLSIVDKDAQQKAQGTRKTIKIGYQSKAPAVEVTSVEEVGGKQRIDRKVYFTDGRYDYKLNLECATDDFSKVNADFNYILSTLNLVG